jgi:MoxR-like ATPase
MMPAFSTVDDVITRLREHRYVCDRRIATALYLADRMQKPILVEGPAGVGKTELAKVLALSLSTDLIRLQCYEGLDEAKALYEWEYPKQLLYTQILRDKIGEVMHGTSTLAEAVDRLASQEDAFFSERFLLSRPLLAAIRAPKRVVLLVDEVDRADAEFEAFLLEVLSDFQVSVPELGTIKAKFVPLVLLTSNNAREMTDALKRRCLHLHIGYPDAARELEIVQSKVPEAAESLTRDVVRIVQSIRGLDLKKRPSVSETLDWARALTILNAESLTEPLVQETLNLILKYEGDIDRAKEKLREIV